MAGLRGRESTLTGALVGRLAAASRPRLRHSSRAADRVSRRTDRRRRSAVAAALLAAHRRAGEQRHHGAGHDALPRRSGALPSHRHHSCRPAGGARHRGRVEAGVRRQADPRGARVAAGGGDAAARGDAGGGEDEHLRDGGARGDAVAGRPARRRCRRTSRRPALPRPAGLSSRRSRTCFSTSRRKAPSHEGLRRRGEGVPADRQGPPHADDPALRAGVLPAAVRLRAQLRHPQHSARGAGQRSQQRQPGGHLRVRELRLLRARPGRAPRRGRRRRAQPRRRAGGARHSRRLRPGRRHRAADRGAGADQRRQREYGDDGDGLRRRARERAVGALRSAGARRLRARPAADGGDARLVQPGASQHPLSRARPDCVHRDADGGGLDGAVDRPREGSRHDGAGEDVAGGAAGLRHRQDDAVFRRVAGLGDRASWRCRCCCSTCRCADRG